MVALAQLILNLPPL
jgi:hypothetical protein